MKFSLILMSSLFVVLPAFATTNDQNTENCPFMSGANLDSKKDNKSYVANVLSGQKETTQDQTKKITR